MNDVKITLGGDVEAKAAQHFVDAWHRAERGEVFQERHLAFESFDALFHVLSEKRVELLRYVHRNKVTGAQALARSLGREEKDVRSDIRVLSEAGLLDEADGGIRADYDVIEAKIAI